MKIRPPVESGGELSPLGPQKGEGMKETSKKTAQFSQKSISSQGARHSKATIEKHRASNKPAEGSKKTDQAVYEGKFKSRTSS